MNLTYCRPKKKQKNTTAQSALDLSQKYLTSEIYLRTPHLMSC